MSARAEALADRFNHEHNEVLRFVEGCSAADWQAMVSDDQCSVGVLAQHIAIGYELETEMIRGMVIGQPPPAPLQSWELLNEMNARNAEELRDVSPEAALTRLCDGADRAERFVRALSDEELARTAAIPLLGGATASVEQMIEQGLVGHPGGHLTSARAALDSR